MEKSCNLKQHLLKECSSNCFHTGYNLHSWVTGSMHSFLVIQQQDAPSYKMHSRFESGNVKFSTGKFRENTWLLYGSLVFVVHACTVREKT